MGGNLLYEYGRMGGNLGQSLIVMLFSFLSVWQFVNDATRVQNKQVDIDTDSPLVGATLTRSIFPPPPPHHGHRGRHQQPHWSVRFGQNAPVVGHLDPTPWNPEGAHVLLLEWVAGLQPGAGMGRAGVGPFELGSGELVRPCMRSGAQGA